MKHVSLEKLRILLIDAENQTPVGSNWRHYRDNKGEKLYTVTGHAINESDDSVAVLYQNNEGIVFSRPLAEFVENVRGGTQKRFQKIIIEDL